MDRTSIAAIFGAELPAWVFDEQPPQDSRLRPSRIVILGLNAKSAADRG